MIPDFRRLFIGFSTNESHRFAGSSGGVGTELLYQLLNQQKVDRAIGVGFDTESPTRPVYKEIATSTDVKELSGSKYVYLPVKPLLDILHQNPDKKYAVVVPPCFVAVIKKQAPNAVYIISFFCGYNITQAATDYLVRKTGFSPDDIAQIDYRGGEYPGGFTALTKTGETKSFGKECYEIIDLMFLRKGCGKCHYYISPDADIVIGDAWLNNLKNASVIMTHSDKGDSLFKDLFNQKHLALFNLTEEALLTMHKHNISYKYQGHSRFMKVLLFLFNNAIARAIAPFSFFCFLSRQRRKFAVGITYVPEEVTSYE